MSMNLDHLRTFSVVAGFGNITRATTALGRTQSAVSRQIQALERDVGARLFSREGRAMVLTEAGRLLLEHSRRVFGALAETLEALDALRGLERGHLRVGAATTIGTYLLPGPLGAFKRAHAGIDLTLDVANKAQIIDRLLKGEIDLGFVGPPIDAEDLAREEYLSDDLGVITAPSHPLAGTRRVTARDLVAEVFITRERGSGTREIVEEELTRAGVDLARMRLMEVRSTEAIKQAVAANVGISIVSRWAVTLETLAGRLWFAPVADLRLTRQLYAVYHRRRPLTHASRAFLDLLREDPRRRLPPPSPAGPRTRRGAAPRRRRIP